MIFSCKIGYSLRIYTCFFSCNFCIYKLHRGAKGIKHPVFFSLRDFVHSGYYDPQRRRLLLLSLLSQIVSPPKFENRHRYRLTFFLIVLYEWEGVQSEKKVALHVGIALGRHVFAFWRHKSCPHPKFKKRYRYWPTSFFNRLVWMRSRAERKKIRKRCEKKVLNSQKKVWNR